MEYNISIGNIGKDGIDSGLYFSKFSLIFLLFVFKNQILFDNNLKLYGVFFLNSKAILIISFNSSLEVIVKPTINFNNKLESKLINNQINKNKMDKKGSIYSYYIIP